MVGFSRALTKEEGMAGEERFKSLRIAMISTPFLSVPPRDYGGTELIVYELVEGLMERGQEVTLFATGDSVTKAKLAHLYPESKWPPNALTDLNHVSWSMAQIAAHSFDLIHTHCPSALSLSRLMPDIPMIYTIHHDRDEQYSDYYRHFYGTHYIAISHNQKQLEVPLPCCDVIHHGMDPDRFEWRAQARNYVCFLGRYSKVKGPHTAIDVAGRAGLPIYVAGEVHPDDREFAEHELTPRLNLPHVRHLGCVDFSQKVPLLRDARALLSPLEWEEPFGLVLIEAMLSGCPVVAFPRGSVPELIEDGVTGFIADSPEQMAEIVRPGGVLEGFDRRRCRNRAVEQFNRDRLVTEHLRLYHRVIAGHSFGTAGGVGTPTATVT
jgi:glycosyltransferase involved in cell wall biosynthesis